MAKLNTNNATSANTNEDHTGVKPQKPVSTRPVRPHGLTENRKKPVKNPATE